MYVMEWNISTYKDQTSQRVLNSTLFKTVISTALRFRIVIPTTAPRLKKSDSMQKGKKIFPQ